MDVFSGNIRVWTTLSNEMYGLMHDGLLLLLDCYHSARFLLIEAV